MGTSQIGGGSTPTPPTPQNQNGFKKRDREVVIDHEGFYLNPLLTTILIFVGITTIAWLFQHFYQIKNIGYITFILSCWYIAQGFKTVEQDELGLVLLFSKGKYRIGPGLAFIPGPVMRLEKVSKADRQDIFPGPDDQIFYGDTDKTDGIVPAGKILPIRIKFGPKDEDDNSDSAYDEEIVATVKFGVNWWIYDILKFKSTITTVEAAKEQIRLVAERELNHKFSQETPSKVGKKLQEMSDDLQRTLDLRVVDWGVDIISVLISPIQFNHDLNKSVTDTARAGQTAKQVVKQAGAEAEKTRLIGVAQADAKKAMGKAEASARLVALKAEAKGTEELRIVVVQDGGLEILQLKTAEAGLKNNPNLTVITGEDGLLKSVAGMVKTFQSQNKKEGDKK